MYKQQIFTITGGLILLVGLYLLGPTVNPNKSKVATGEATTGNDSTIFQIEDFKKAMVAELSSERQKYLAALEANVKRGDVKDQQHTLNHLLAGFWKDSVPNPILHYYYASKLAKLDNTEKSLTFAAHSILGYLAFEQNHDLQHWLAGEGKQLFEKALVLNASNDSSIVGLGGCIMYGAPTGDDGNPMAGIMKVREVAERDSTNMHAQYMLGVGGIISGQFDKAIERFEKVAKSGKGNHIEVLFKLAEACERAGNKEKAALTYQEIESEVANPAMKEELKKRIKTLREG